MAIYNLTNISGSGDPLSFVTTVNNLTGGVWASLLLLIGWVVIFGAVKGKGSIHGFSSASIVTAVLAILLKLIGLVPDYVLIMASILGALGFVMLWFE